MTEPLAVTGARRATEALRATLLVSCRDRTGLVAALSDFVFRNDGNIVDADQHAEDETGLFFMRLVWEVGAFKLDRDQTAAASFWACSRTAAGQP